MTFMEITTSMQWFVKKKKKKKLKTNFDLQKLTDKTNGNAPQRWKE